MLDALRFAAIALNTVFWGALACVGSVLPRGGDIACSIGRAWVASSFKLCGVTVSAEGLEHVQPGRPYVFMSNHQSVFDIAALIATLPGNWRFVAKRELIWIPFFGWALVLSGQFIVDRGRRDRAVRSLRRAAERVRSGTSVVIYPEGTRSESGALRDFKSGGFYLAIESGVPILPVSVSGSRQITPKHSLQIRGGPMRVVFGKPIPTDRLTLDDRASLKAEVRRAILDGLERGQRS